MPDNVVENPALRQRYSFRRAADADGTEVLHVNIWVDPGGAVTPHIHPAVEERFEVLAGKPSFLTGSRWRSAAPGETAVVAAGVRHAYRNTGDEVAHIACQARPPSSLQEFLEEAAALGRARRITRNGIPTSLGAALECAAMAHRHREMVVLLFPPMPPPSIQRLLLPGLARLGERRGH